MDVFYKFTFCRYRTEDSARTENGVFDRARGENGVLVVSGSYNFVGPDRQTYQVDFVADENGYRPMVKSGMGEIVKMLPGPRKNIKKPFLGSAVIASLTGGGVG
jgi:hypothetical protein